MGATGSPTSTRLATLTERRKIIEDTLVKHNQELKALCLKEAELTGTVPPEMPLEPGESPPVVRRRVGTAYELPESLVRNVDQKDEVDLELQIQLHANMAEATFELANQSISDTLRRQHLAEYNEHNRKLGELQGVKDRMQQQQQQTHKVKKKPRPPELDDNVSMGTTKSSTDSFVKSELRHSQRSVKIEGEVELRQPMTYGRGYAKGQFGEAGKAEDCSQEVYRLSINEYRSYIDSKVAVQQYNTLQHLPNYNPPPLNPRLSLQHSPKYYINSHPPHTQYYSPNYPQNATLQRPYHGSAQNMSTTRHHHHNHHQSHHHPQSIETKRISHENIPHQHQIQPHQQYEHASGLGGYWKRLDNGETIWCSSSPISDANCQRDKRFSSLDRRKNKGMMKRISPSVDHKSATLGTVSNYSEQVRTAVIKAPEILTKRQSLIRTQSLGSVGVQTIDSSWQSDENSSIESESVNGAGQSYRKPKQKEWVETSLDVPVSPTQSVISRSHSAIPSVLSPEEKYAVVVGQRSSPIGKPSLEIPAESNPSPRVQDANLEMYNNNIPRNCTIVQAGQCKPYYEETKPFVMSDFYKYSTKYKKSPSKPPIGGNMRVGGSSMNATIPKNLNKAFDCDNVQNHNFTLPQRTSPYNMTEKEAGFGDAWYLNHNKQSETNSNSTKIKSNATLV